MRRSIDESRRAQGIFNKNLPVPMSGVRTRAARRPAAQSAQTLTAQTEVPFGAAVRNGNGSVTKTGGRAATAQAHSRRQRSIRRNAEHDRADWMEMNEADRCRPARVGPHTEPKTPRILARQHTLDIVDGREVAPWRDHRRHRGAYKRFGDCELVREDSPQEHSLLFTHRVGRLHSCDGP